MKIKKSKHVGSYGVIINNGKVLLIRKARGAYKGKLDLPGGGIDYGETPIETLKREILEEVGVNIVSYEIKTALTHYEVWQQEKDLQEDLSHYAIIYDVKISDDDISKIKKDADGIDSLGSNWYDIESLDINELSPLAKVIKE